MDGSKERRVERGKLRAFDSEWNQIEARARAAGLPVMRYVREAALGAPPTPRRSRAADALALQLGRVANNLRQLVHVAEIDGDDGAAGHIQPSLERVRAALAQLPAELPRTCGPAVERLLSAGVALNARARWANTDEELVVDEELLGILASIGAVLDELNVRP